MFRRHTVHGLLHWLEAHGSMVHSWVVVGHELGLHVGWEVHHLVGLKLGVAVGVVQVLSLREGLLLLHEVRGLLELKPLHLLLLHVLGLQLLLLEKPLVLLFPRQFLLLVYKLEKLFSSHGEDLVESAEHESLEVVIRNAENRGAVALNIRVGSMEDIFLPRDAWLLLLEVLRLHCH